MAVRVTADFDERETVLWLVRWLLDPERRDTLNAIPQGCLDLSWGPSNVAGALQVRSAPLGTIPRPIRRIHSPLRRA